MLNLQTDLKNTIFSDSVTNSATTYYFSTISAYSADIVASQKVYEASQFCLQRCSTSNLSELVAHSITFYNISQYSAHPNSMLDLAFNQTISNRPVETQEYQIIYNIFNSFVFSDRISFYQLLYSNS